MIRVITLLSSIAFMFFAACSTSIDTHDHTSTGRVEAAANDDKAKEKDPSQIGIQPANGSVGAQQ